MSVNVKEKQQQTQKQKVNCYHCGESCNKQIVQFDEKDFCCEGCKQVYDLLKENHLCTYYNLNDAPGISPDKFVYTGKHVHLDTEEVRSKLIRFSDGDTVHVSFFVPKIHCTSCIWLLENLHKLNNGIASSSVDFLRKEATIIFNVKQVKLSEVVELMSHIGYEPLISLNDLESRSDHKAGRKQILKIGLAGFCFGNIMMLSFPEYFSLGNFQELERLSYLFAYLNLFLALPVFFYSASDFFVSAWKSIRYRYLNIDAPIALAILVTFLRSVWEILSHQGAGYMDSMTGIVFFMLIGRYFQNRTYTTLSFERDYKSYFPVGVTRKNTDGSETNVPVSELKKKDRILIRNSELIPADAKLISDRTHVDYSFITGESIPVKKEKDDVIYAGGKQVDGAVELEVITPVSQSYLTRLWNRNDQEKQTGLQQTYVDKINKYFTIIVLSISSFSALYWLAVDSNKALNAMTAVLIVACPCGLLLTTTFANGNILRILGKNKFYLKNAAVINNLAKADTIIFDKTGTITRGSEANFVGPSPDAYFLKLVTSLAAQSSHPLSRQLCEQYNTGEHFSVDKFEEISGKGLKGIIDGKFMVLGSSSFVNGSELTGQTNTSTIFISIDGKTIGYFTFKNAYRKGLTGLIVNLSAYFKLKVLSGDNDAEKQFLRSIFGKTAELSFNQKPDEKMTYVQQLRAKGHRVIMIGDGLNDAGALRESNVGIAVSDDTNTFSPACDAILDGSSFTNLPAFIRLAKAGKKVIMGTFVISLIYNIIGVVFSVQGNLSPVIAAILMPLSTISIVLITTISTSISAKVNDL